MVDCSHANSNKQHRQQEEVARSVVEQRARGNKALIGLMVESYLEEGNHAGALDAYRDYSSRTRTEFGVALPADVTEIIRPLLIKTG